MQWEAYPHYQYIHTNGALACCDHGGCWKSRTVPLHDGDEKDQNCCVDVVGSLPRCMDMITAEEVIRRIGFYFQGGVCRYLDRGKGNRPRQNGHANGEELKQIKQASSPPERAPARMPGTQEREPVTPESALKRMDNFIEQIRPYRRPGRMSHLDLWRWTEVFSTRRYSETPSGPLPARTNLVCHFDSRPAIFR